MVACRTAVAPLVLAAALSAQELVWHDDLAAATELAARDGKPLLLLFRCEP